MGLSAFSRILACLLCCLALCGAVPARAEGELNLASEAAVLMDAATGQVLYGKNMHQQMYPASITKVMTALLALTFLDPQQELTVSQAAVDAVPRTSSHISLKAGEKLTVEQAMYALAMESANDAANVLAEAVSGSMEAFGQRMTQEARDLGACNTNFTNANGLPDSQHYTTAYDMALITAAALRVPGLAEYFRTVDYLLPRTNLSDARTFSCKNRFLPGAQYDYGGVLMAKTGWTTAAQGTFIAAVQQGDTTLIAVTLKSPLLEDKYQDSCALMDYGFSRYTRVEITGEELSRQLNIEAAPEQTFSFLLPVGSDIEDVTFLLTEDAAAISGSVTVAVVMPGVLLPNITLRLPVEEAEIAAQVAALEDEQQIPAAVGDSQPENPHWWQNAVIVLGLLALLDIVRRSRRSHMRRQRRRDLDARIRHMKRRMR